MTAATFNSILHACDDLNFNEKITLAEKITRRAIRERRAQLKKEWDVAVAEVKAGNYIEGVDGLFLAVDKKIAANAKNKKH